MNVGPLLKSQMYYPLLLMKMDGTELDKGCEITKTGVIWEREPVSALFTRFTWNRKLLKYAAPKFESGADEDGKKSPTIREIIKKTINYSFSRLLP